MDSRWQLRKILNSPLPMEIPNIELHMNQLLLRKTWKLAEQLLHSKGWKDHIETSKRGRDMVLQKSHPHHGDPQLGGISQILQRFTLWSKGFVSYIRHLSSWNLHQSNEPTKHLSLKTNRAYIQDTQMAVGNGKSALEGLLLKLIYPRTKNKSSNLKSV